MQESIKFDSDGLNLSGVIHKPHDFQPDQRCPAFIILHGFGGHKDGPQQLWTSSQFAEWGYITMRFDYRGCGESEGPRGHVIPLEEVEDTKNAINYMASRPDVDPKRIALSGTSYGAAVAVYSAGVDKRVAAVISQGGWADGEKKARQQHPSVEAWQKFTEMLERGRKHREDTGKSLMVHRYDIVPVPEHLRPNIDQRSIFEFPVETPLTTMAFRPADMVGEISPRPLLLLHAASDKVTPASESIALYERSGPPTELHLLSNVDHFMFGENSPRVINLVRDWLDHYFPAKLPTRRLAAMG